MAINNVYPGGVKLTQQPFITRPLPSNTTPVTVLMTRDGGAVVEEQRGVLSGVGVDDTINLEFDNGPDWDTNIVGSILTMLSGDNQGVSKEVITRTDGDDIVTDPFPESCVAGDRFKVSKPKVKIHKAWMFIQRTCSSTVRVAIGGVVAGASRVTCIPVDNSMIVPIESRDGFNEISIYAPSDLDAYEFTFWGL